MPKSQLTVIPTTLQLSCWLSQVLKRGEQIPALGHPVTWILHICFYTLKGTPPAIQLVWFRSFVQWIRPPGEGGEPWLGHRNGPFICLAGSGRNHLLIRLLQLTDSHLLVLFFLLLDLSPEKRDSTFVCSAERTRNGDPAALQSPVVELNSQTRRYLKASEHGRGEDSWTRSHLFWPRSWLAERPESRIQQKLPQLLA